MMMDVVILVSIRSTAVVGIPAEETANPAGSASQLSPGSEVYVTYGTAYSHT